MPAYLPIAGTWGWGGMRTIGQWWQADSPFAEWMRANDWYAYAPADPFVWDTSLSGILPWRRHTTWEAAAHSLNYYFRAKAYPPGVGYIPKDDRRVIAHSHGLQVVLLACGRLGLHLHTLISVGSPVRSELYRDGTVQAARANIGAWLHLYDPRCDLWQFAGEFGDGSFFWRRQHPLADKNVPVPGGKHARILTDPTYFPLWAAKGWLGWLQQNRPRGG